jgi:uncharacterized protein
VIWSTQTRAEAISLVGGRAETGVIGTDTESEVTRERRTTVAAMTAPGVPSAGAVALRDRALAPDAARGAMLLLIALANVHLSLFDRPLGVRSYPAGLTGPDAVVAGVQVVLVDGRAYPLFGLLFGYGLGQLAARRAAAGVDERVVVRLVRRRGWWLVAIGAAHAVLLWSGDIVAAYGLLAVALGGMVVTGTAVSLATTAVVGSVLGTGLGTFSAYSPPGTAPLPSIALADPVTAAVERVAEWAGGIVIGSLIGVVGAVALGALAARFRVLDEPAAHRRLLGRVAAAGLGTAVLAGLPLALAVVGLWRPGDGLLMLAGFLHTLGGYAGGLGYVALFGVLAIRGGGRVVAGSITVLAACGQRSLSCYLGQSVLFVALLPAWTLGLGAHLTVAEAALLAVGVWLVLLVAAVVSARAGYRGPAETLLRRLTYGQRAPRT